VNATTLITAVLIAIGLAAVVIADYLTGTEIRITPLYFLPLMLAAWRFGRTTALAMALLVTVSWAVTLFLGGRVYSQTWIWPVNLIAQAGVFLVVALLVSGLRDALQRERDYARTDPLTGLPNRRSFYERVGSVLAVCHRNSQPATLAYVDLDNFKQVNDSLGHHKGDVLLKKVADVMNETLRSSDVAARIGGDEFVVLLPETGEVEAAAALEKVRSRLERAEDLVANDVTVSIGAVTYLLAPSDVTRMIKAADKVMYRVKAAHKNNVIVQGMDAA